MDVSVMLITPEMAKMWLLTSNGNPRWPSGKKVVDPKIVSRISEDIKNGKWNPGNNSIAFDSKGTLVDGHHRLSAIVESGISVTSIVVFGVEESGLLHIDENRSRSVAQRTKIPSTISTVANCHKTLLMGYSYVTESAEGVMQFVKDHPLVMDAYEISNSGADHAIGKRGGFVHGVTMALEYGESKTTLSRFCRCVNSGYTSGEAESSAIAIRNLILQKRFSGHENLVKLSETTQSAINDFVNSRPRRKYPKPVAVYFNKIYKR